MTGDVQLPDMIDPDAPHLEFRANQCRDCGEAGPVTLVSNPEWWQWFDAHRDRTGHTRLYQWKLERAAGQTTTIRPRRQLGTRGA